MRYIICFFTLISFGIAHGQKANHRIVLGGSFALRTYSNSFFNQSGEFSNNNQNVLILNPYVCLQPNERWLFGLQGGISLVHFKANNMDAFPEKVIRKQNAYSIGVLARRSFLEGKPIRIFLEPGIRYSQFNTEFNPSTAFASVLVFSEEISGYVSPGISWTVSDHFRLLAKFGNLQIITGKYKYLGSTQPKYQHQLNLQLNAETLNIGAEVMFGG